MNFLYYKNFGEDKPVTSHTTYKKKKDPRKAKQNQHGNEGHAPNCECEICINEFHTRTHLLLDMSYSRFDPNAKPSRKTTSPSIFSFFNRSKKSAVTYATREEALRQGARLAYARKMELAAATAQQKFPEGPLDPVSLSTLKQDCFMIPVSRMHNFFPAGHTIPAKDAARLRMVETSESDVRIVFHLIGAGNPFLPSLTSPLVDMHQYQQDCIVKAFKSTISTVNIGAALQGMVLLNLEKGGELWAVEYPFMIVWAIDSRKCDALSVASRLRQVSLEHMDPGKMGFTCRHSIDTFEEVATLARPPLEKLSRRAATPSTGYIISVFKVFEGDDSPKFERNWLGWTGARTLYSSMTTEVGLRRLTLHKGSVQKGTLHYILLCDCSEFLPNLARAVNAVPKLRMRLCGDTGLYRPICTV